MRTIPRKLDLRANLGNHRALCDYCGAVWMRSDLWMDRSGLLNCPDEGAGRDTVTLSEENARAAIRRTRQSASGRVDRSNPIDTLAVRYTSAEELP